MSLIGDISGYQSLFNMTTNDADTINVNTASITSELDLKYISPHKVLVTNANQAVIGATLTPVTNQTTVSNDGLGTLTIGTVQDINTTSDVVFHSITSSFLFGGIFKGDGVTLTAPTNQIVLQEGKTYPSTTINIPKSSGDRILKIPDVGTTSSTDFVMCRANQDIYGIKTFMSSPILSSLTASLPLKLDATNTIISQAINLASSEITGTLTIARGGTNSTTALTNNKVMVSSGGAIVEGDATSSFVKTSGDQTITGTKTFTNIDVSTLRLDTGLYKATLGCDALTSNRYISFPNIAGTVALLEGTQTFGGQKTFSSSPIFNSVITSDRLAYLNSTKQLQSVTINNSNGCNIAFVAGSLNCSLTQDIQSTASPTFNNLSLNGTNTNTILLTNGIKQIVSATIATTTGMTASASSGTLTINTPQDLQTTATPTFTSGIISSSFPSLDIRNTGTNTNRANINLYGRYASVSPLKIQQTESGTGIIENFATDANVSFLTNGTGTFSFNKGIYLPGTAGSGQSELNCYYEEKISTAFTGALTGQSSDIRFKRIGTQCFMNFSLISGTATSTATIYSTGAVPTWCRPLAETFFIPNIRNNTYANGLCKVDTSGDITFYATGAEGNFTSGNAISIRGFSMNWSAN